ncbi:MAG: NAD(P)-dependent methylenetetrahydromethanopterin dehydrogenase [Chromatiaceae bacterium]
MSTPVERPYLLHMITTAKNLSPFDVNMAYDAGWNACTPYVDVSLDDIQGLVQDAIFSRGPKGVRRTGIFLGGRDAHLAIDMLEAARKAMVPPFEVSVCADPSGAFTTAGAMVACVESALQKTHGTGLSGQRTLVFGGTGPVGSAAAVLAARAGADTLIVSHQGLTAAQQSAAYCSERYGVTLAAADGSSDERCSELMREADVVFNAAKAGIQVLGSHHIAAAGRLKVACDVNAVPPKGIEGVELMDNAEPIRASRSGAVGIGALAVGNVKYKAQNHLLTQMREAETPQYLGFDAAFEAAREYAG